MLLHSIVLVSLIAVLSRWCISLGHYSGEGQPPMYGDYEAQRHWMELTVHHPVHQWYENSSTNDLEYWGLDYPPLTAYHSYVCGKLAAFFNKDWVRLYSSRGFEGYLHKLFMRSTVLAADVLVFFPAVILFVLLHMKVSDSQKVLMCLTMFLYPGLQVVDHGHFQYNCVSLGLFLLAVTCVGRHHDCLGSVFFCLALNYKQMELYHAMPFFCFLLAKTFRIKGLWKFVKLMALGVVVTTTFAICWLPFLTDDKRLLQLLWRLFPFSRGLFEDKVANVWCSLSVVIKIKEKISTDLLVKFSMAATSLCLLPSSLDLLVSPSFRKFKVALLNSSLIFFMFSYQVHEKSILIPNLSACLLLDEIPVATLWFLSISSFSLLPLLIKDGHALSLCVTGAAFTAGSFLLYTPFDSVYFRSRKHSRRFIKFIISLSLIGCICLTGATLSVPPPPTLPDLYPVIIGIYSCFHFTIFLLYFHYVQFTIHSTNHPSNKPAVTRNKKKE